MSTPSGKPFDPFDLSPYAPKRARENADRTPVENGGNDPHEDAAAVALAYVPRAAMWPAEEHAIDLDGGTQAPLAADTCGEKVADDSAPADADLARLESSLRWLQREGAVGQLPRAVQLSPVPGLPPLDPQAPRPRAEQFINGVRVPPSLASERLRPPPPMRARRDNLRGPLRVLLASVIAAPIAYYLSVGNSAPAPGGESALASFGLAIGRGKRVSHPQGEAAAGRGGRLRHRGFVPEQVGGSTDGLEREHPVRPCRGPGGPAGDPRPRAGRACRQDGPRARSGVHQAPHAARRAVRRLRRSGGGAARLPARGGIRQRGCERSRWAPLSTRPCWRKSACGAWGRTSRRRAAGTSRPRNSARPKLRAGSSSWRTGSCRLRFLPLWEGRSVQRG